MMLRFLLFLSLLSGSVSGQITLSFEPLLGGRVLVMNDDAGAGFGGEHAGAKKVEVLRWYLSDLELLRGGKTVFTPKKRHHMLDAEKPASLRLQLATEPNLSYDELRFTLGVDSLTAASGVFGQDLGPHQRDVLDLALRLHQLQARRHRPGMPRAEKPVSISRWWLSGAVCCATGGSVSGFPGKEHPNHGGPGSFLYGS